MRERPLQNERKKGWQRVLNIKRKVRKVGHEGERGIFSCTMSLYEGTEY